MAQKIGKNAEQMQGFEFGRFKIDAVRSRGTDYTEFHCIDAQSKYRYALRLSTSSAGIIETLANSNLMASRAADLWKSQSAHRTEHPISIYAIRDNRYL